MTLIASEILRARTRRVVVVGPVLTIGLAGASLAAGSLSGSHFDVTGRADDLAGGIAPYLVWVYGAVGAVLVGAEFGNGGVAALLTWEPRRGRIVATRLGIAALVGGSGAFVSIAVVGVVGVLAVVFGPFVATTGPNRILVLGASFVLASGAAALIGGAIAFVARSAVGGVVAMSALMAAAEPVLGAVTPSLLGRGPMLSSVVAATPEGSGLATGSGPGITWLVVAFWVVVAVGVAYQSFVAFDVKDGA